MAENAVVRMAAVGDIHTKETSSGELQSLFRKMTESADIALLCGDLTDYGTVEEAEILAHEITSALRIPAIGVLGNHDFESGLQHDVARIVAQPGVTMLDGDSHEVHGIGFAGVK
ncbi:MAG: metallophosphoesterase family protein, partial [Thermoanaerobaculia bacterium]